MLGNSGLVTDIAEAEGELFAELYFWAAVNQLDYHRVALSKRSYINI